MTKEVYEVAERFADLVVELQVWKEATVLSPEELSILLDTVNAAGFEALQLVPGRLYGDYLDQDGSRTGDRFPVNKTCPLKVIGVAGKDNYAATGWLDELCSRMARHAAWTLKKRGDVIRLVAEEIERSIPLAPIQLTVDGDVLREYPPTRGMSYFVEHTRDTKALTGCVGIHDLCDSWVDRKRATKTHDALVCRGCYIRVLFPREVATYGELRRALVFEVR
jgi:hypothetical protein